MLLNKFEEFHNKYKLLVAKIYLPETEFKEMCGKINTHVNNILSKIDSLKDVNFNILNNFSGLTNYTRVFVDKDEIVTSVFNLEELNVKYRLGILKELDKHYYKVKRGNGLSSVLSLEDTVISISNFVIDYLEDEKHLFSDCKLSGKLFDCDYDCLRFTQIEDEKIIERYEKLCYINSLLEKIRDSIGKVYFDFENKLEYSTAYDKCLDLSLNSNFLKDMSNIKYNSLSDKISDKLLKYVDKKSKTISLKELINELIK